MKQVLNTAEIAKVKSSDAILADSLLAQENKAQETNKLKLEKTQSFNRFLEANCDCV